MHPHIIRASSVVALSAIAAFVACGGSTNTGSGGNDAGAEATVHHEAGGGSSSGSSSGGAGDDGGGTGDDGGPSCPDQTTFAAQPFASVGTGHKGVCKTADITAFVTACGDNGTQTTCTAWQNTNIGDAGTACGNCILDPTNAGATWSDQFGFFSPNYGGCIEVTDATNGKACAQAYDAQVDCEGFECDSCADAPTYKTCATTVDGAICKQYATSAASSCASDVADGGALTTCSPGAASQKLDPDFTYIATLICGSVDGG
jgi:hypothetical protein